jgi:hypothetical protein
VGGWCRSGIGFLIAKGLSGPDRDVLDEKYYPHLD